jgi:hypothetical protein
MDTDIVDVLLVEHDDLRRLLTEVESTAPAERAGPFRELVARLASHEAAEEAVVHRALRDEVPDGGEVAAEVLAEEAASERLLATMEDMDPASEDFAAAFATLRTEVLSHAAHEEAEEFPLLREHLSPLRRDELGELFVTLRDAGPTHPHPHTPQLPEIRAAAGPIVGFFDRARDAVRDTLGRDER